MLSSDNAIVRQVSLVQPAHVRRTPRISCEAVPASVLAGAGMSRHLSPRNGAGESFVSFIRLFGRPVIPRSGSLSWR